MEFNSKPSLKLNTKHYCLFCLEHKEVSGVEATQSFSILQLLRYLQVSAQLLNESNFEDFHHQKGNIKAELCKPCRKITARFSVLALQLEKVQIEMNCLLEGIHRRVYNSGKDPNKVQNYSKRMTNDPEALAQLVFVDNLRKQLLTKSLSKQINLPCPCIKLTRVKPIRKEIAIFKEERDDDADNPMIGEVFGQSIEDNNWDNDTQIYLDGHSPKPEPIKKFNSKRFKPNLKLLNLQYERNPDFFKCKTCNKKYQSYSSVVQHYKTVHLKTSYKCNICNVSVFARLDVLGRHKKICRRNVEKQKRKEKDPRFRYVCNFCGARFDTRIKLGNHSRNVHRNIDRYPCDLCDKKFKQSDNLKRHRETVHLSKRFACRFCGKKFKATYFGRDHERKCGQERKVKIEAMDV